MTSTHPEQITLQVGVMEIVCRARLPDAETRCWNDHCDKRETCRRYLGRNTGGVHVLHTVFPDRCCEKYIHGD